MPSRTGLLMLNSAVAYALALMVTITVHEFGHALTALGLGLTPTVRPSSVDYGSPPPDIQVVTALAGPLVSLVTGLVLLAAYRAVSGRGFWHLVLLWLGALGVQEFSGYLMTGPFVPFGDIGEALQLLSAPSWAYGLAFVVGVVGTVGLGALITRWLLELTDPDAANRSAQLRALGLFAWLIGSAVVLATGGFDDLLSAVGFFELLGTLTIGIFLLWVRFFTHRQHVTPRGMQVGWPVSGIVLIVLVGLARHFVLGPGLRL